MAERSEFGVEVEHPVEDVAVVVVTGEVDLYTAQRLREALAEVHTSGARQLIVDLTGVPFIDSSGIDALVGTFRRLQGRGARLDVVGSRANVMRVFEVTGLLDVFAFHASREDALAAGESCLTE